MLIRSGLRPLHNAQDILEVMQFLERLEGRIHTLSKLSDSIQRRASQKSTELPPQLHEYVKCRDYALECWSFAVVIERRLQDCEHPTVTEVTKRFNLLVVTIWSVLLDTSLKFLNVMSQERHLPLGSRNLFMREIQTLQNVQRYLSAPPYIYMIDTHMRARTTQATKILNEITTRAPSLLDFGGEKLTPTRQSPSPAHC